MIEWLQEAWPRLAAALIIALDIWAASHAILYKRDPRSATSWIGVILLFPVVGAALYVVLGINRIQRRALLLRSRAGLPPYTPREHVNFATPAFNADLALLAPLATAIQRITGAPLLNGNRLHPLRNGDEAYPAMLDAIENARTSITLCSYIFAHDKTGLRFADALGAAVKRGVEVRVLIDDVGARYSMPTIFGALNKRGVRCAAFIPTFFHWHMSYINLRNHRKIMVVDGMRGFTGGMNLRHNNVQQEHAQDTVQDLHFMVEGPVVSDLQEVFADDWAFATGERLTGKPWFTAPSAHGNILARAIVDGPDENHDKLRAVLLTALAFSQQRVRICTPYFLPDLSLISALNTCAIRGVHVDIIIPAKNNLYTVGWAMQAQLWQVLARGCHVWRTPAPFDHSKICVIDDAWSLIGSSNWDSRSLRLNFEFNLECYSRAFAATLNVHIDEKIASATKVSLAELDARPLLIRLRDSFARLFWPFL